MEHQDWKEVKWDKRAKRSSSETKKEFMKRELRAGRASTVKRYNGNGMNNLEKKMDKADEEGNLRHKKISMSVAKRISQKRLEKKMSQVELAKALYLPVNTIKEYEKPNSKVIPSAKVLNKIEKILGRVRD